ncbi:MAG: response regulator transcription factor [Acidimicrobiales bacterium]
MSRNGLPGEAATTEGLTRRERQIVLLAADGRSSRAIAASLEISVRTVDNHLGRAYQKLGVRGRGDLEALRAGGSTAAPPARRVPSRPDA